MYNGHCVHCLPGQFQKPRPGEGKQKKLNMAQGYFTSSNYFVTSKIRQDMAVSFFEYIKNDRNSPSDDGGERVEHKTGQIFPCKQHM